MPVTEAARLLDVGRPALSNLLNGNASLSPDMAARLERTFGASALSLLDMQAEHDAARASEKGAGASARAYVPAILQAKARDIEAWGETIASRQRFAVLLRTLVHSTSSAIAQADFPGNDDSERPGWDGFIEAGEGTPWIPEGKSGWEFGVNRKVKEKADKDYKKAVKQTPSAERAAITFVFVSPRRWTGKNDWRSERLAEGHWKDVRVLDASDLEQWLEQSIPAQAWLADERGVPAQGVRSLEACWRGWAAVCAPHLTSGLFDEAIEFAGKKITNKLKDQSRGPIVITADSCDEALAFLSCLLSDATPEMSAVRDRVAVFTERGPLTRLVGSPASLIPVVASRAVEAELGPHHGTLRSILIYPRSAITSDLEPDVVLEPLSYSAFEKALHQMGFNRDEIDRLGRESGRSPTVLRRRLAQLPAIRTPEWAGDVRHALNLMPFIFAGAWKNSPADETALELLANGTPYEQLESRLAELLTLDNSPVWSIGSFRGLVSKIDALFAISRRITEHDLERFFDVATTLVLSEEDPALDLPEEQQWMAGAYGKRRELSGALREGIGETLVLLAVHGRDLFRSRFEIDPAARVGRLIRELLTPLTARKLQEQSGDLPMYAEAAPDEFLEVLEEDLASPDPESFKLMRPVTATFGRCHRTGLLWALENTAWAPERLLRTVRVLARLAEPVIDDNWSNKPIASLEAIFRSWMPQTAAKVDQRIAALNYLVEHSPKIAWPICIAQLDWRRRVGHYSHKPRWRLDGHGYGEPVTRGESQRFMLHALERALSWREHSRETLGDLVELAVGFDAAHQRRVWELISDWSESASDEDKAVLRERVRASTVAKPARKNSRSGRRAQALERDEHAYDRLEPKDIVLKHAWLFKKTWVQETPGEFADEKFNFRKREQQIEAMRVAVLREVLRERGAKGVLELAEAGEAPWVVGVLLPNALPTGAEQADAVRFLIDGVDLDSVRSTKRGTLISGLFARVSASELGPLLASVAPAHDLDRMRSLLLMAPFRPSTWRFAESLGPEIEASYWRNVTPIWGHQDDAERVEAVDRLLAVGRPRAAFTLIDFQLELLAPRRLYRLLEDLARSSESPEPVLDTYRIAEGFKLLTESGDIPADEIAGLEFLYIEILDHEQAPIPNLEKHINEHPELFVQAIVATYRRSDGALDREEWRAPTKEIEQARASKAHRLLDKVSSIPGRGPDGVIEPARLRAWITDVRAACAELARTDVCDRQIGALLARAPVGEDGVWPCEPVRDVLDEIAGEYVCRGATTEIYNSRGVHMRAGGGGAEHELAKRYEAWAAAVEFTHPGVAKILRRMVEIYQGEAGREDDDAEVRRRLLR